MRKKIPLIGGIINLIESLKGDIGIIENTDVATHSISAGSYVIWHNELYKASSAIAVDDALSSSNLTAVSGGVGNELKTETIESGLSGVIIEKTGNVISLNIQNATIANTGYSLPAGYAPSHNLHAFAIYKATSGATTFTSGWFYIASGKLQLSGNSGNVTGYACYGQFTYVI